MNDDFDNPFIKPVQSQSNYILPQGEFNNNPIRTSMSSPNNKKDEVTEELERRQKELDAKAAELAKREAEQNRIAQEQARQQSSSERRKNFPPLPKFFPCAPCFYVNIDQEIPEQHQLMVRYGFRLWLSYSVLTIINFLAAICYLAGASDKNKGGTLLGTALFGLLAVPPLSFVFWFLPLYKAFKTDSSINFFIFFAIMGSQIIVMLLQFVGVPNFGVCGLIYLVGIADVPWLFAIVFIIAIMYALVTGFAIYLLKKVHYSFRHSDANFNKAKSELFTNLATDSSFRSVAANLVTGQTNNHGNSNSDRPKNNPENMA